jgi:hypothetical protein
VAPAGIQFRAEGLGFGVLRPFHELRYKWTFPETGDYARLPASHPWPRERSEAFGPVVGFTFETPGTHTVTCEVTDGTTTITETVDVIVDDPETVFAASTITVGTDAGDDYADLEAAMDAATAAGGAQRLLLRRGDTFTTSNAVDGLSRLQFGAFGTGQAPIISTKIGAQNVSQEVSVWGLRFQDSFDPTTGAAQPRPTDGVDIAGNPTAHGTVHDCDFQGIDIGIAPVTQGGTTIISDCGITDWHDYGIQGGDVGACSIVGTLIRQSPLALGFNGPSHKADVNIVPTIADHGPIRLSRPHGPVSFDNCDLFSNSDWSGNGGVTQTIYRLNTGGIFPFTCSLSRQRTEGGQLAFGSYNPNATTKPSDFLLDKFAHVATLPGSYLLQNYFGGATIRNGVLVHDNVPAEPRRAASDFVRLGAPTSGDGVFAEDAKNNPVRVHNLTLVDLRERDNLVGNNGVQQQFGESSNSPDPFTDLQIGNNIIHVPNAPAPITADGPLDMTPGAAPVYVGRRVWAEIDVDYSGATSRFSFEALVTGSISGATGRVLTMGEPSSGSFGGNDAAGQLSILPETGAFVVGDVLTEGSNQATIAAINGGPGDLIPRFANTPVATASFRPQAGSLAINDTDGSAPVAIDDFAGVIRGPDAARGALEPV